MNRDIDRTLSEVFYAPFQCIKFDLNEKILSHINILWGFFPKVNFMFMTSVYYQSHDKNQIYLPPPIATFFPWNESFYFTSEWINSIVSTLFYCPLPESTQYSPLMSVQTLWDFSDIFQCKSLEAMQRCINISLLPTCIRKFT